MSTEQKFHELAQRCVRLARVAEDPDERQTFLKMADAITRVARLHVDAAKAAAFDEIASVRN